MRNAVLRYPTTEPVPLRIIVRAFRSTNNPGWGTEVSGTTTVKLTARDDAGNAAECSFEVRIDDQDAPRPSTAPGPQTIPVDGTCEVPLPNYAELALRTG